MCVCVRVRVCVCLCVSTRCIACVRTFGLVFVRSEGQLARGGQQLLHHGRGVLEDLRRRGPPWTGQIRTYCCTLEPVSQS